MLNYVQDTLNSFQYPTGTRVWHALHPWVKHTFGQKVQITQPEGTSELLTLKQVNVIQKLIGKFHYYARAVDHTILVTLGELATKQTVGGCN